MYKSDNKLQSSFFGFNQPIGLPDYQETPPFDASTLVLFRKRINVRKHYLSFAKSKKHSAKQIHKVLKKQLSYVKLDIGYLESFMSAGYAPKQKDIATIPFYLQAL